MLTLPAFVLAIALLILVHEYGHYRVARACGVKVLRFSLGFGQPLWRRQAHADATEFVIALFPLGGYVKMLDEREAPVAPELRHLAFNTQPLRSRCAIVAAGPLANLVLAVLLYAGVNWLGMEVPAAVLSPPVAGSLADQAGLVGGERVVRAGLSTETLTEVASFEELRWLLTRAALQTDDVRLELVSAPGKAAHEVSLKVSQLSPTTEIDTRVFEAIGITGPLTRALIGDTMVGATAAKAGLLKGDEVLEVDGRAMVDGAQLRRFIRDSASDGVARPQLWKVMRQGRMHALMLTPEVVVEADKTFGRIGAYVGSRPEMVEVRYGFGAGVWRALTQAWEVSSLTLRMMGNMLVGQSSVKNLSGPLSIADYAGKSAGLGLTAYLSFLALISVSLGVLNLLPLPVLDGGHLMYYLWEALTGKSVSDLWMERLQQGGIAILGVVMAIALFNDITRLFG